VKSFQAGLTRKHKDFYMFSRNYSLSNWNLFMGKIVKLFC